MFSQGNNDSIGPDAFAAVCTRHGLLQLADVPALKDGPLKALSYNKDSRPPTPTSDSDDDDAAVAARRRRRQQQKHQQQQHHDGPDARELEKAYDGDDHRQARPDFKASAFMGPAGGATGGASPLFMLVSASEGAVCVCVCGVSCVVVWERGE